VNRSTTPAGTPQPGSGQATSSGSSLRVASSSIFPAFRVGSAVSLRRRVRPGCATRHRAVVASVTPGQPGMRSVRSSWDSSGSLASYQMR
jgi:hypothetical protein